MKHQIMTFIRNQKRKNDYVQTKKLLVINQHAINFRKICFRSMKIESTQLFDAQIFDNCYDELSIQFKLQITIDFVFDDEFDIHFEKFD